MNPRAAGPFKTTSMRLQKGGSAQLDLSDVRCLFDRQLHKYPMLVRHLGDAGALVANEEFERGIVKLQMGQEPINCNNCNYNCSKM